MVTSILGVPVAPRFNVYDIRFLNKIIIREKCEKPPLCYDLSATDDILARDDIKEILGVKGRLNIILIIFNLKFFFIIFQTL